MRIVQTGSGSGRSSGSGYSGPGSTSGVRLVRSGNAGAGSTGGVRFVQTGSGSGAGSASGSVRLVQGAGGAGSGSGVRIVQTGTGSVGVGNLASTLANSIRGAVNAAVSSAFNSVISGWNCSSGPISGSGTVVRVGNDGTLGIRGSNGSIFQVNLAPCSSRVYRAGSNNFNINDNVRYNLANQQGRYWAQKVACY